MRSAIWAWVVVVFACTSEQNRKTSRLAGDSDMDLIGRLSNARVREMIAQLAQTTTRPKKSEGD
jgi:hypothetical protein